MRIIILVALLADLARMYHLFMRVKDGPKIVCDCMRGYLREQGDSLVVEEEEESSENLITYMEVVMSLSQDLMTVFLGCIAYTS